MANTLGVDDRQRSPTAPVVALVTTTTLVVPLAPAASGNGLAMRAGALLEALAAAGPVDVVVVPVAGPAEPLHWAARLARDVVVVAPVGPAGAEAHAVAQLADPGLRRRLAVAAPLPSRARLAPPTAADAAVAALGADGSRGGTVVVLREYLVPLGVTLAHRLGAGRVVVDLDDDVVGLLAATGHADEAAATERLLAAWLPDVDVVTVAAPVDARVVAARFGLAAVAVLPNAARAPRRPHGPRPGHDRLLYVGNLTYAPNVEAASCLAHDVLPRVRRARPRATVALVGDADARVRALAGDGVEVVGRVDDLDPWYAGADAVVVPLRHGSGTRIKVLEAFAHRRPVVASPTALAGLGVAHGREVLVGATPADLAAAVVGLLGDDARADGLVAAAGALHRDRYDPAAVAPVIRRVALGRPDVPEEQP